MAILTWTRICCYAHDDCRANPAIGEDCALAALARGEGVPSWHGAGHDRAGAPRWIATRRSERGELEALVETYAGRVVACHTREERVQSDIYAPVTHALVQHDDGTFGEVYVRAHYECDLGNRNSDEDATGAVRAAYDAHVAAVLASKAALIEAQRAADREAERKAPRVGRRVRVVRGRKVARGTEGDCTWLGEGHYGRRCGIRLLDGSMVWTAASNVEAVS